MARGIDHPVPPYLETLLVARDHACQYHHVEESGREVPTLRTAALLPYQSDYHIHEAMALFAAAPRLETLYSISASSHYGQNVWTTDDLWTLRLTELRKLAITDLEPLDDLELLLRCCRTLAELHFSFVDRRDYWDAAHLMPSLTPVKEQFRHLALTCVVKIMTPTRKTQIPTRMSGALELGKQLDTVDTFRRVENLEVGIEVRWSTTQIGGRPWAAVRGLGPGSNMTPFFSSHKISSYKRQ